MRGNNERRIRLGIFWALVFVGWALYSYAEICPALDTCWLIYALHSLVAFTCGCLFVVWWFHSGKASDVYIWITVLLFAISLNYAIQWYARSAFLQDEHSYEAVIVSWWWALRSVPEMVASTYMLSLITARMLNNRLFQGNPPAGKHFRGLGDTR